MKFHASAAFAGSIIYAKAHLALTPLVSTQLSARASGRKHIAQSKRSATLGMVETEPLSPCNGRQMLALSPVTRAREIFAYMFPELAALGYRLSPAGAG